MKYRDKQPHKARLVLETLEARCMPAVLVSPYLVQYQDTDGDWAEVRISKPLFNATNVNQVLRFDQGNVNGSNVLRQQLRGVILYYLGTSVQDMDINIGLQSGKPIVGNGQVDVGGIDAYTAITNGRVLRDIRIQGDLGFLQVRNLFFDSNTAMLRDLDVKSVGLRNDPQGSLFGFEGDIHEIVFGGNVGSITIRQDFRHGYIYGSYANSLSIGGSVSSSEIGFDVIHSLRIDGDLSAYSTRVNSTDRVDIHARRIDTAYLGGSINVSGLPGTPAYVSLGNVDNLTICGNILSDTTGSISQVRIEARQALYQGNIIGGVGGLSWYLNAGISIVIASSVPNDTRFGQVIVKGDMQASFDIKSNLSLLEVQGKVMSAIPVGDAFFNIEDGSYVKEIRLLQGIQMVTTPFDLHNLLIANGRLDLFNVKHGIQVTQTQTDEVITPQFLLTNSPTVFDISGDVSNVSFENYLTSLPSITIHGNYTNGYIRSYDSIGSVVIDGNFNNDTRSTLYGIYARKSINRIDIKGDAVNNNPLPGQQFIAGFYIPGELPSIGGDINIFHVGGDFGASTRFEGYDDARQDAPGLFATGRIGRVSIGGDLFNVNLFATGRRGKNGINSISIGGDMTNVLISTGRSSFDESIGHSPDSGIGYISIKGSFVASVITTGVSPGLDRQFFTQDDYWLDSHTHSVIKSLQIGGIVDGDSTTDRLFGVLTGWIKELTIGSRNVNLKPGYNTDAIVIDGLGQVVVREKILH